MEADSDFQSVHWDNTPGVEADAQLGFSSTHTFKPTTAVSPGFRTDYEHTADDADPTVPKWDGYLVVQVLDPVKELEGTKDMYISYAVKSQTDFPFFPQQQTVVRRRFHDFVFLWQHLSQDFAACVVPPLPSKHRAEYVTGDRFSPSFVEKRRLDLQRFLQRISNNPTLSRSTLLRSFLCSTEWSVSMHQAVAHAPDPDGKSSFFDSVTDTLVNSFSRIRKADERFVEMKEGIDRFEEGTGAVDRLWSRARTRQTDLATDYHDLAVAVQGLGFLESGITEQLNHFANTLLEFSSLIKHNVNRTQDPFLSHLHSLQAYTAASRALLKLRDQKQLDLEDTSEYLSSAQQERDRLAAIREGHPGARPGGLGAVGGYLRERVDALRGLDDDRARVERMRKLDAKIKDLQAEVKKVHDLSEAFNDETLREQAIFQAAKQDEMKEMLGKVADGNIEMYQQAIEEWDAIIPMLQRIRVDV
ncbi:hypothetical protein DACRYDRAFT_95772 [Dacryopinax primogenitus]|uniref:Sorting nexin-4 n=1 Tax=Dacryopinax primogenitus (strain DJM 731) TaxID=1858805 RepID=M5FW95_DACPD|nr:uncharacterized protein DACRYDRAFT_95772 [Dacryopinax primogenitus]EJT99949.1 hypothetical protein DACRYDRAFT_95772 [Dacryopinax primogenitus]